MYDTGMSGKGSEVDGSGTLLQDADTTGDLSAVK